MNLKVEQARAELDEAESSLQIAKIQLEKAVSLLSSFKIVAPFDGLVTQRGYHVGAYVQPPGLGNNKPLLTIARTDKMRVVTNVPDRDVPFVDVGDPAEVRLDALPGQVFRGKVARFAGVLDPASRTMRTEFEIMNPVQKLHAGMYGIVKIALDTEHAMRIATTAVMTDLPDPTCYRIIDGRTVKTVVRLGVHHGERVEVLDGLKEGDLVVVDPLKEEVQEGQMVEPEVLNR